MDTNKRVIALGFFDGVHLGHGALLRRVVRRAEELGAIPAAVTFDAHPRQTILGAAAPLLTTPAERGAIMGSLYGIRDVIVAPFDDALMHMDWRDFVTDFLVGAHHAVHLVVGHDFRFGYQGRGNAENLQALCKQLGMGCDVIEAVLADGAPISSTRIRALIARGDMEQAAQLLGHPHCLTGQVLHGKKLGSRLGFPTVNLTIPEGGVMPAFAVYATRVWVDGVSYAAVTNVGVRPTVDSDGGVTVEGTLLDFSGSLYGKTVRMEFHKFLRPEQKFPDTDALRAQVMADIDTVRAYFQTV